MPGTAFLFLNFIVLLNISQILGIDYQDIVKFSLYKNKKLIPLENRNIDSLFTNGFMQEMPIRILIHGWLPIKTIDMEQVLSQAWEKKGNFNIIWVDWSELAENIVYFNVARQVTPVGKQVASFVKMLMDNIRTEDFEEFPELNLVGFGLGAHIAGEC